MKRNSYYFLIVLFILSACAQPEAAIQPATATQRATATMIPTPTIEPYIEKLTDDFKGQTEELYGETKLEMQNGEWSLLDVEGRQVAGFIEGKWWINYTWVGPKNIPSWDREEYLCDDEVEGSCGKLVLNKLVDMKVEDYPFPENFENNPFVKKEMESIEKHLTEDLRVPLGNIPIGEDLPKYPGSIDIILSKVALGQGKDFRWTILPYDRDKTFPQWPTPVWLAKVDEKGVVNPVQYHYFYKINDLEENVVFKNASLRRTYAATPAYNEGLEKTDSNQFVWVYLTGTIASETTDEFLNNQKWTLIPYGSKGDVLLVHTSGRKIYEIFRPDNGDSFWIRQMPEKK